MKIILKNLLKGLLSLVGAIILLAIIFYFWYCIVGETIAVNAISCNTPKVSYNNVQIMNIDTGWSSMLPGRYQYRIEEDVLYIRVTGVLVGSFLYLEHININKDFSNLKQIVFEDGKRERVIWDKDTSNDPYYRGKGTAG